MRLLVLAAALPLVAAARPLVGETAPDFALSTPQGKSVRFSELVSKGPVVLLYPGPPQDLGARANEFLADKKTAK